MSKDNSHEMTPRERWLAAIAMRPVDRLPFWPKLNSSCLRAQREPFKSMGLRQIHDWIGSDKHEGVGAGVGVVRRRTSVDVEQDAGFRRTIFRTPYGDLQRVCQFDECSQSWHPIEFPVKTPEDIDTMIAFYEDADFVFDEKASQEAREQVNAIGDDAVAVTGVGQTPLMHFVEWEAGIENAHYLLSDCTEKVESLFAAAQSALSRKAKLIFETSQADLYYLMENTSTTLISPAQYRTYGMPQVGEIARMARSAGKPLVLHMCGHLKKLLPDLATLPASAYEAFTSPTLGNTTLMDGRTHCPDVCLIGGTNAMLWTRPADDIIAEIEHSLDALPHHRGIVVTSAGVMPPICKPETIRSVCEWVKSYPVRN